MAVGSFHELRKNIEYEKTEAWNMYTDEDFQYHVPRGQQERANALEWLKNYRDKYFNGENI